MAKLTAVTAGLYTVGRRSEPQANKLSCDIWMGVIVLFSPSADKSHSAVTNSNIPDRCVLFWVNYELLTPDSYTRPLVTRIISKEKQSLEPDSYSGTAAGNINNIN